MEPTPPGRAARLEVEGKSYAYYSIAAAEAAGLGDFGRLPASLKVVLENMLRFEDGKTVTVDDIRAFAEWAAKGGRNPREIAYRPARVLMQDFTGVPAVVDLAAMRDGIKALGGDPQKINPLNPVDLVIDHSVMIDEFGTPRAFQLNVDREYERNIERYQFLKWGQSAFDNFRVVPPGTGICHQVNLEYLAQTVWTDSDPSGALVAYPDTLVGTDSHTTMVNGLAVLGWGVGGIEAEAAMLGQPVSMLIPEVVGFKLTGRMMEGTTATDLVLKVVQMLRKKGVVSKFVEFYGDGLDHLPLADRATIANMAPEYGATCGFFPIDGETLRYLRQTGRDEARIALVEAYAKENGMWRGAGLRPGLHRHAAPRHGRDRAGDLRAEAAAGLHAAQPGGRRLLQDRRRLSRHRRLERRREDGGRGRRRRDRRAAGRAQDREGRGRGLHHPRRVGGDRGDHLLHQHLEPLRDDRRRPRGAQGAGARADPQAVGEDLAGAGQPGGQRVPGGRRTCRRTSTRIGFNLAGYGCTTCIGNSGPLGRSGDLEGDRRQRPRGDRGAVGQPQLRGPHLARRAGELPRRARRSSSPTPSPATSTST